MLQATCTENQSLSRSHGRHLSQSRSNSQSYAEKARLLLAAKLFEIGRLSLGQAAKVAGYSKSTFMELLGRMGIPVLDYPADDLAEEIDL